MMKRLLQSVLALLLFGAAFTGCVKTEVVDEGPREAMVRFDVELPDVSVPATRAIQTENEAKVNSFYVLVFDKNDEFAYKKIVPSSAFTSETSGVGSTAKEIKTFNVSLLKSSGASDLYNVVLLANVDASTALTTAVNAIVVGDDRETVLEALTQTYTGNPAMPVPMASVPKAAVQVTETTSFSGANAFNMIRMVARIDVTLASSVATNYSVKRVLYYNYNTVGRVWTKNYSGTVTTGTTLPPNPGTATAHTYYTVANTRTGGLADTHFEALLYAQEAAVNSATNRPCIVVELEDKTGASVGHYRADFLTSSGSPKYLDILRNHRYKVEITNVYSNGFTDPDDAYNSTPVGMEATVVDWDEADMKNTIVNGNYWVSISSRELRTDYTAKTDNSISITTNVSTGWSVVGVYNDANCTTAHGGAWLTNAAKSGNNLTVTVTENTTTNDRTVYVKLKAGAVEFTVKVMQDPRIAHIRRWEFCGEYKTISSTESGGTFDSHYDYRPLTIELLSTGLQTKVEILNTDGTAISGTPWLQFSLNDNYADAYTAVGGNGLLTSATYDTSSGTTPELHLYADEYITVDAPDRKYIIRITAGPDVTDLTDIEVIDIEVSQKTIQFIGKLGGVFDATTASNAPYSKNVGVEHYEEFNLRYKSTDATASGIQWGFYFVTTGETYIYVGSGATWNLAARTDHGISGTLTRYNNYAARYCYEKNRDLNGDGILSVNELVWYLPAQNQTMSLWVAHSGITTPFGSLNYWSATENTYSSSWSVHFNNGFTATGGITGSLYRVRCVRDL